MFCGEFESYLSSDPYQIVSNDQLEGQLLLNPG